MSHIFWPQTARKYLAPSGIRPQLKLSDNVCAKQPHYLHLAFLSVLQLLTALPVVLAEINFQATES